MINYDLSKIRAFIFDVDGVLSRQTIGLSSEGEPLRTVNIRDGYAINVAVKGGFGVAVITGGNSMSVRVRCEALGVKDIYMQSSIKMIDLADYMDRTGFRRDQIAYIGDDIPDYHVMMEVGLPIAPADADHEIKRIAKYISPYKGGEGVARDVIEQTLRTQGLWMNDAIFEW